MDTDKRNMDRAIRLLTACTTSESVSMAKAAQRALAAFANGHEKAFRHECRTVMWRSQSTTLCAVLAKAIEEPIHA